MTQALASRGSVSGLPALPPPEPRLSPTLGGLIRRLLDPHPSEVGRPVEASPQLRDEARAALRAYVPTCGPAGPAVVHRWLLQVNAGTAAPLGRDDFELRAAAIAGLVGDLPLAVFHGGTLREAQAAWKFFPGTAEAWSLLNPHAAPLLARVSALRRVAAALDPPSPRPACEAEVERIAARMRDQVAEMRGVLVERERAEPEAAPPRDVSAKGEALRRLREARGVRPVVRQGA